MGLRTKVLLAVRNVLDEELRGFGPHQEADDLYEAYDDYRDDPSNDNWSELLLSAACVVDEFSWYTEPTVALGRLEAALFAVLESSARPQPLPDVADLAPLTAA